MWEQSTSLPVGEKGLREGEESAWCGGGRCGGEATAAVE